MSIELTKNLTVLQISPFAQGDLTVGSSPNAVWQISGCANDGSELFRVTVDCPHEAGQELHKLAAQADNAGLVYHDACDRSYVVTPEDFGDTLAEVMWDTIDREEDVPDSPADYAPLADDHPIDALRHRLPRSRWHPLIRWRTP